MRVFRNARFRRFMDEHGLGKQTVCAAVVEISSGLIHANLGGGVYKQRMARVGQGKSGGFRTVLFFRSGGCAYFITGFAKNEQDTLSSRELVALKQLAKEMLSYDEERIQLAITGGAIEEINCEEPF